MCRRLGDWNMVIETEPDYRLNEWYETARKGDVDHLSFCMGDLFAGIVLA